MARKREISFFTDIKSDEELEKFLEHANLIALDVYQELFGPCTTLHYVMENKKISLDDSNTLQLATCNADKIEKLARFRNKSYPTIVFCRHKKVIDISYGANIPQLQAMLDTHIRILENKSIEQPTYEFDELLPFEIKAIEQQMREKEERIRKEKEAARAEKYANLDNIIELMNQNSADMGITLFMPHVAKDAFRKTNETAKWVSLVNRSLKIIQLTPDMMETLNYQLENPIDERIMEQIYDQDILIVLWYTDPRNPVIDVIQDFIERVTTPQEKLSEVEGEGTVWETILEPLIIDPDQVEEDESIHTYDSSELGEENQNVEVVEEENLIEKSDSARQSKVSIKSTESSDRKSLTIRSGDENETAEIDDNLIVIPPVWTPANLAGQAIFKYCFFRNQFEVFLPPVIEPDPPHLCMIFPAKVRNEVLEACEEYPKDLLNYGFFDGDDFDNFNPVCKTVESFEELFGSGKEKLILKVSKKSSLLALDLVKFNPLYVSHTVEDGEKECSILFHDEEEEEESMDVE